MGKCKACEGTGESSDEWPCFSCGGTGKVKRLLSDDVRREM